MLKKAGFSVLSAANGREALEVVKSNDKAIDLVLTDIVMPQMNGKKLAEELEKDYPAISLLFMSGYTDKEIFESGVKKDRSNFIAKPFTAKELMRKIHRLLSQR